MKRLLGFVTGMMLVAGGVGAAPGLSPGVVSAAGPAIVPVVPGRLLETRQGPNDKTVDGAHQGAGMVAAGTEVALQVEGRHGVSGAAAVMLNVTAVGPDAAGYLTVYPCGEARPLSSSVNYTAGQVVPNAVLAKLGAGGKVCIWTKATTHILADVTGYVPTGGGVTPVVPGRILETRQGPNDTTVDGAHQGTGLVAAGTEVALQVEGRHGVSGAAAVMLNVTAVGPDAPGYLTVYPCGEARPLSSSVNYTAGQVVPNAVLAKLGAGGKVCIWTKATTHILADVTAFVPTGGGVTPVVPGRILETRQGPNDKTVDGAHQGAGMVAGGSEVALQVEGRHGVTGAAAVMLNVTAVGPDAAGYLTVYPCGEARPLSSSVNYTAGQVVPNAVLAKVGAGGKVCIWTKATTHILADVTAYVPGTTGGGGGGGGGGTGGGGGGTGGGGGGGGELGGTGTWSMFEFDNHSLAVGADGTTHLVFSRLNVDSKLTEFWYAQCYEGCHQSDNWLGGVLTEADDLDYIDFDTGIGIDDSGRVHVLVSGLTWGSSADDAWSNYYATCESACTATANWHGQVIDSMWTALDAQYGYGRPGADTFMVHADGTVALMAYSSVALFASCLDGCTSAANWTAGRALVGDADRWVVDAVVGADGTYHAIFDGDYTAEGDMLVRYARCSANCNFPGNWQKSPLGFELYSSPDLARLAITDSGRVFVGYPQSDLPSTPGDDGELYVLATCAGTGCVDLTTWTTFSLTGSEQDGEGVEGSDLATFGESVALTTTMSIDDVWGYSCAAGCASPGNWTGATLIDSADLLEAELPATSMVPGCASPYNAFWYPGEPAVATGPGGTVVVHNPHTLYKCTSSSNVSHGPSIGRVISSF